MINWDEGNLCSTAMDDEAEDTREGERKRCRNSGDRKASDEIDVLIYARGRRCLESA